MADEAKTYEEAALAGQGASYEQAGAAGQGVTYAQLRSARGQEQEPKEEAEDDA